LAYKRDWSFVSGHKVLFTVTHQERMIREKKSKEIGLEMVVREHSKLQIEERVFTGSLMDQG